MSFSFRMNETSGRICCCTYGPNHETLPPEHPCDKCKAHFAALRQHQENNMEDDDTFDGTSPNSYEVGLADLRAAASTPSTPESRFAEQYQAERRKEFEQDERDLNVVDEHIAATPLPRLTDAELEEFAPPDPYAPGIKALREARR